MLPLLLVGCVLTHHPVLPAPSLPPSAQTWEEVLSRPGPIALQSVEGASWRSPTGGLLDVRHPTARAAGVRRQRVPISIKVAVLRHPQAGTWLVDTGVCEATVSGKRGPLRGPMRLFAAGLDPKVSLASALGGEPVAGVLVTHAHFDHLLGLPDLPPGTPIYMGRGELEQRRMANLAMRPSVRSALRGHDPVREWPWPESPDLTTPAQAVDILGDGSLWALPAPGHTAGHTAYLALTTEGPVLFVGDASHTRWGWEHQVGPGWFSADGKRGEVTLASLHALVDAHPGLRVEVGHEMAGQDAVGEALRER